jgi:hypothetical protein
MLMEHESLGFVVTHAGIGGILCDRLLVVRGHG